MHASAYAALFVTFALPAACLHGQGRVSTANGADSAAVDSVARSLFALDMAPGMAVAVVRGSDVVYAGGFGLADREARRPVTPETIFYIASTTKAFTGLAAAALDVRGVFALDSPLSRYLPDVRLHEPLNADSISIRSLLSHTHGIANGGPVIWRTAFTGEFRDNEQLVRLLVEHPAASTGREFQYGNIGYNVASLAMDRALGRSWKDVLVEDIFTPLAMTSTSAYVSRVPADRLAAPYSANESDFDRQHYGKTDANMHAAGGIVSSARDMTRWLEAQLNEGRVDGRQVLPAAAVKEAQRLQAETRAQRRGLQQVGYGLGWQLLLFGADTLYSHGGGFNGFAAHISFLPAANLGVAVFANDDALGSALVELVALSIYERLAGPAAGAALPDAIETLVAGARQGIAQDRATRAARLQTLPHALGAYAGTFTNPLYGTIELRVVNGVLEARAGAAVSAVEVYDAASNQLRVELTGSGSVLTVEFENGGAARIRFAGQVFERG
jgi:CubicO group peptidase (beta-lactamase class C family)